MMKKRITAWIMALMMLFQVVPTGLAEETAVEQAPAEAVSEEQTAPVAQEEEPEFKVFVSDEVERKEYAVITYKVTEADGTITDAADAQIIAVGEALGKLPVAPEKEGVEFLGWQSNGALVNEETVVAGNMELVAVYGTYPSFVAEGAIGDIKVKINVPEGSLPAGSELKLALVDSEEIRDTLEGSMGQLGRIKAVDISFVDAEGNPVQPLQPVSVQLGASGLGNAKTVKLAHIHEDEVKELGTITRDTAQAKASEQPVAGQKKMLKMAAPKRAAANAAPEAAADDFTFNFDTDSFSVFALAIVTEYVAADGNRYKVTVTYGPEAEIPSNATLNVREITKGSDEFFVYYNKALKAAGLVLPDPEHFDETVIPTESTVEVHEMIPFMPDARFFDVSIMADGVEVEPKAAVEVRVEYIDALQSGSSDTVSSVHFADDEDELIDAQVSINGEKQVVTHSQDGFSVTGDVVISMMGDADPDDPGTLTAQFSELRASEPTAVLRADGENAGPKTTKNVTDNGDGTYKIRLNITGEVEHETEVTKANVIVVLDRSGSMDTSVPRTGHDRWYYATQAVNNVASTLLNKNGQDSNPDDLVEMALVSFSTTASTNVTSTTKASDISAALNRLSPSGGTNWEGALQEIARVTFDDDGDATYVIFVSDGNPTFRMTKGNYDRYFYENNQWHDDEYYYNSNGVYGSGSEYTETVRRCFNEALDDAKALVNSGREFYTIGAFGNVDRMQSLTTGAGASADHYFSAANADDLSAALAEIAEAIEHNLGYTDVSTTDGVPALSHISANVTEGQVTGFTYYKNGEAWNDAPTAKFENNAVTWDLSSENPLEDQTIYSIEFDVWPSQESYDLIADLNNGLKDYDSLPETTQAQINDHGNGTYSLKTNTRLTTTYTKNGTTATDEWDKGDNSMPLPTESLSIKKIWNNPTDWHIGDDSGNGVKLYLTKDGERYLYGDNAVTVAPDGEGDLEWESTSDIYISCGMITQNTKTKEYVVKETGHDYTITEPDTFAYYWDMKADTYRPMVINGVAHYLIKNDSASGTDGVDFYTIAGHKYVLADSGEHVLEATNDRRSHLNFSKTIVDESVDTSADHDTLFAYTFTVNNTGASAGSASDLHSDYYVWFSVWDPVASDYVKNLTTSATAETAETGVTGFYYAVSGTPFTVSLKEGWNLRILNMPLGTTYSVAETVDEGWKFDKAEGSAIKYEKDSEGHAVEVTETYNVTVSGSTVSGRINESNHSYSVLVTNKWVPANIYFPVKKVMDVPAGLKGPSEWTYTITVSAQGNNTPVADVMTGKVDNTNDTIKFGPFTYTTSGTYVYNVTEAGTYAGVTNDTDKTVTVTVVDNEDGTKVYSAYSSVKKVKFK